MTAVLKGLLFLLKCIGILLLVILGLLLLIILLVLLAPVRYKGKLDKKEAPEEVLRADGLISWLNPLVRVRIQYTEKKLKYTVRILGICLLNSEKTKKEKQEKVKKKKTKPKKKKEKKKKTTGVSEEQQTAQEAGRDAEGTDGAANIPAEEPVVAVQKPEEIPEITDAGSGSKRPENTESSEEDGKKTSVFAKIKALIEKIKAIPEKIKQKVTHFIDTLKLLWYKKEKVVLFLQDELHKTAIGKAWKTVKQILHHVLPGKIKGHVEFGTGDPASTGKALGVLGVLYAWYGKGITVVPDFYEKRVVAELSFKGRIRLGTLLIKGLRLIRDKHVKRFVKNFKKLLKILKQKAE